MNLGNVSIDPTDLTVLRCSRIPNGDGKTVVYLGNDEGATVAVSADDALEISEAWRSVEQLILERTHGVQAVL